jgi:hypothetical protein
VCRERAVTVERQIPYRDAEAERLIRDAIARQPSPPYYMAQTVVLQEHALNAAQSRIADMEAELTVARQASQGGFLSGLFGGGPAPRRTGQPSQPRLPQGAPGGFLAGAAQTAMGVAGGVLLANVVTGLFADDAHAAEAPSEADPDMGDGGFDDSADW